MGRMRVWALIFALLLTLPAVLAQSFSPWEAFTTSVDADVKQGEDAIIELSLINNQEAQDSYRLLSDTFSFTVRSELPSDYLSSVPVPSHDAKRVRLHFRPVADLDPGTYQVSLTVKSALDGSAKTLYVFITLRSDAPTIREYFAAVDRILKIPGTVDPRQPIPVDINLRNRNPKNISKLELLFKSRQIEQRVVTSLAPLETRVVHVELLIDPFTPPQDDVLEMTLFVDNVSVQPVIKEPFTIMSYSDIIAQDGQGEKSFLSAKRVISVTNKGNAERRYTHEEKISLLDSFFTRSEPASYTISKDDATYLAWDLTLKPNETRQISVNTSYLSLFVVLLLLVTGVIFYFIFRSPVVVRKEASVLSTKEGGIAKMKILIHVKNRTDKSFDKVTIVDRIPNLVEIEREGELGTIKPTRIFQSPKEGTTVKWEIGSLEKYEERLITYKIRSKLTILGGINLPTGMVTYSDKKGKENIARSNRLDVSI